MYCCAFGCKSDYRKNRTIKFFKFPWNQERREQWTKAVNRKDFKPSNSSRLCENHFITGQPNKCPDHPDYVPSIFSFSSNVDQAEAALTRFNRAQRRREANVQSRYPIMQRTAPSASATLASLAASGSAEHQHSDIIAAQSTEDGGIVMEVTPNLTDDLMILATVAEGQHSTFTQQPTDYNLQATDLLQTAEDPMTDLVILASLATESGDNCAPSLASEGPATVRGAFDKPDILAAAAPTQKPSTSSASLQTTPKKYRTRSSQASTPKRSNLIARLHELTRANSQLRRSLSATESQLNTTEKYLKRVISIENLKFDATRLKYYTGIESYEVFETLCRHLSKLSSHVNIKALSLENCVLMILVKIRRNLGMQMLCDLFGVSAATVTHIFDKFTPLLAKLLSTLIINPSSENVLKNLPKSFKRSRTFRRTRFIIDCTEIFIQRPTSLTTRAQTYSHYKGRNTAKVLVACTPTGGVAYVSKAWGGRVSDIELVRKSGFYDLLQAGDHVLADRGFPIAEDLSAKGVTISVPSFTRGQKQLSGRNVESSALIARVRIHVERCIGRMKNFKLLTETVPILLMPHLDDFISIAAGLCNLMSPLVINNKKD